MNSEPEHDDLARRLPTSVRLRGGAAVEVGCVDNDQSVMRLVAQRLATVGILLPNEIVELNADELVDELHRAHVSIALVGGTTSAHTNGRRAGVIEVRQRGQLVLTMKWREFADWADQA